MKKNNQQPVIKIKFCVNICLHSYMRIALINAVLTANRVIDEKSAKKNQLKSEITLI